MAGSIFALGPQMHQAAPGDNIPGKPLLRKEIHLKFSVYKYKRKPFKHFSKLLNFI